MNERAFYEKVRRVLHDPPLRLLKKLQDAVNPGLPDSVWIDGAAPQIKVAWIEFKRVPLWPKRASTTVKIALTPNQRRWLEDWAAAGGNAFCLLSIADEWFLFRAGPPGPGIPFEITRAPVHCVAPGLLSELPRLGELLRHACRS